MIKGLTHLAFDHNNPDNTRLARNFRELTNDVLTLSRQSGGIILKLRETPKTSPHEPPVAASSLESRESEQPELPKP